MGLVSRLTSKGNARSDTAELLSQADAAQARDDRQDAERLIAEIFRAYDEKFK